MEDVRWRIVDDDGWYWVSNLGEFFSFKTRKKMKPGRADGRKRSVIVFHGKLYQTSRVVAKAFPEICGEWFEGCEVHHIDRDPNNNVATNLIVVSPEEHRELHKNDDVVVHSIPVFQYDLDWNFLAAYDSIKDAAKAIGCDKRSLHKYIDKPNLSYYGYRWLRQ